MTPKPRKPPAERASQHVHLRITGERKARYVESATLNSQTLTRWITAICDNEASDDRPDAKPSI